MATDLVFIVVIVVTLVTAGIVNYSVAALSSRISRREEESE